MRKYLWQILAAVLGLILIAVILLFMRDRGQVQVGPQPVSGGSFIEAEVGTSVRLNPLLDYNNRVDRDINALLFSGLLKFDSRAVPQPDLAEGWAISADATLYTFYLREDAYWHDGQPVTADDVIFTYSKFLDEDYPGPDYLKDFWSNISITRIESKIVQFDLPEPFAPFLDYLTVGLLPDHLLRGVNAASLIDHPYNLNPIGTGPFIFEDFLVEDGSLKGVSLIANNEYYGTPPFLQRFEFEFFEDENGALEALLAGEVQGLYNISRENLPEILKSPALDLHSAPVPELHLILLNLNNPEKTFFTDKNVRQALMLAINRQYIIDEVFSGQAILADSLFLPGIWAAEDPPPGWTFDPDEANNLLDESGWELPPGVSQGSEEFIRGNTEQSLTFTMLFPDNPQSELIAAMLQDEWASIGIQVELEPVEPDELLNDRLELREYQAALVVYAFSNSPDPDPYPFWHDSELETGQNYSSFSDRNISIWLEQSRTTPDVIRRSALYKRFLYRFNELLPGLPLFFPVESYAVNADFQAVSIGPLFDASFRFYSAPEWFLLARSTAPNMDEISAEGLIDP